jgi:hypothetical protein
MFMRERPYGGWLWILNLAVRRVDGVLMRFMGRLGWGFGRISGSFGGSFLVILDSRSVMTPNLDSGIMSSLDKALKASFLDLVSLPLVRMLQWQIFWRFLVTLFSGMLTFLKWLTIGRWIPLPPICCTLHIEMGW